MGNGLIPEEITVVLITEEKSLVGRQSFTVYEAFAQMLHH